ncbi:DUF6602 domain-containing protein [Amycolatopsis pithecellobii]|uniref:DUF6602 domain-containing protein n=1 Tax=Amycolatopsis pithecellobii TaxID=664692 RepID=A0A6N7Z2N3_9PSEU|nr:DUF6602 domain-containing protein [Amycolatopsis pithecellobii]MTD55209.1 hypothetical protein [Amycolatopsis pithecellobii]
MSIVEQYWAGVLQRLQAEVDNFNRLIGHQGEKGRENEQSLSRVLERLVPSRYGVGSGLLIDSDGRDSRQMDIVVYEQNDEPTILAQTNQVLFPVENVRACIEVKTTADKEELVDGGKKKASLDALNAFDNHRPAMLFFAYRSNRSAATVSKHINLLKSENNDCRPDLFCILELGLVGGRSDLLTVNRVDETDYVCGITPLQEFSGGVRQIGRYRNPPDEHWDAEISIDGTIYPIVEVSGDYVIAEPSRALLLFCDALLIALAKREGKTPAIHRYITDIARDILLVGD